MTNKKSFELSGSDNKTIIGDITYSTIKTNKGALFVHGFKGFKDWGTHNIVADYFAKNGITYVKFNFSYSGVVASNLNDVTDMNLFAANTPSKELFDLDVVINYLKDIFPDTELSLIGHSRGGGIGIIEAGKNSSVSRLITWSAISSFNSLWKKDQEDIWREKGKIEVYNARTKEYMPLNLTLLEDFEQNLEKLNILKAAKNLNKPWLIIHGNDDVNVNVDIGRKFKELNSHANFLEIEGANHVFGASHPFNGDELPAQLKKVCDYSIAFIKS